MEQPPAEGRYPEAPDVRRRPIVSIPLLSGQKKAAKSGVQSIAEALKTHCNIPGDFYFLATVGNDGNSTCFTTPSLQFDYTEFFDVEKFERCMARALAGKAGKLTIRHPVT